GVTPAVTGQGYGDRKEFTNRLQERNAPGLPESRFTFIIICAGKHKVPQSPGSSSIAAMRARQTKQTDLVPDVTNRYARGEARKRTNDSCTATRQHPLAPPGCRRAHPRVAPAPRALAGRGGPQGRDHPGLALELRERQARHAAVHAGGRGGCA